MECALGTCREPEFALGSGAAALTLALSAAEGGLVTGRAVGTGDVGTGVARAGVVGTGVVGEGIVEAGAAAQLKLPVAGAVLADGREAAIDLRCVASAALSEPVYAIFKANG